MPYYYGGYGDFLANNIYFLLLIPVMILSLWAQVQVSGSFDTYSRVSNRRRLTGAQAAEAVLRANGVYDVTITSTWGKLTDHYDPRDNTIYLSQAVYSTATVAAVGVAAHEAGHAESGFPLLYDFAAHRAVVLQPEPVFSGDIAVFPDDVFPAGDVAGGV